MLKSVHFDGVNKPVPDSVNIIDGANEVLKKKRKKRPKKKKTVAQDDSDNSDDDDISEPIMSVPTTPIDAPRTSIGDPVLATVLEVIKISTSYGYGYSFSKERITECVRTMWDEGLAYDDAAQVLYKLISEDEGDDDDSFADVTDGLPETVHQAKEETAAQNGFKKKEYSGNTSTESLSGAVSTDTRTDTDHQTVTTAPVQKEEVGELTLGGRLELVAAHTNLGESLQALRSWYVVKGEEGDNEGDFRTFFESKTLDIIFKRIFSSPQSILADKGGNDGNVREGVVALLSVILKFLHRNIEKNGSGNNSNNGNKESEELISVTIQSIMTTIDDLLTIITSEINTKKHNKNNTASALGKRVSDSVRAMYLQFKKSHTENQMNNTSLLAEKLESHLIEIDRKVSEINCEQSLLLLNNTKKSLSKEGDDKEKTQLQMVFKMREMAFDKTQLLIESLESILSPSSILKEENVRTNSTISTNDADIHLENILLEDNGENILSLKKKKDQGVSVLLVIEKLKRETDTTVMPMMHEINKCTTRLKELNDKQIAIQLMLQTVEQEITALNTRKITLKNSVQESQNTYERTVLTVGNTPNNLEAINATKLQEKINDTIVHIHKIEKCFLSSYEQKENNNVSQIKNGNIGGKNGNPAGVTKKVVLTLEDPVRVDSSYGALGEYVRNECQCLVLLSGRVVTLSSQLINLKRELNAYRSLNMIALVNDVDAALKKVENDVCEDKKALVYLQNDLVECLERFSVCLNLDAKGLMAKVSLTEITTAITSLKHANAEVSDKLQKYAPIPPAASTNGTVSTTQKPEKLQDFFSEENSTFSSSNSSESLMSTFRNEKKNSKDSFEKNGKNEKDGKSEKGDNSEKKEGDKVKKEDKGKVEKNDVKEKIEKIEKIEKNITTVLKTEKVEKVERVEKEEKVGQGGKGEKVVKEDVIKPLSPARPPVSTPKSAPISTLHSNPIPTHIPPSPVPVVWGGWGKPAVKNAHPKPDDFLKNRQSSPSDRKISAEKNEINIEEQLKGNEKLNINEKLSDIIEREKLLKQEKHDKIVNAEKAEKLAVVQKEEKMKNDEKLKGLKILEDKLKEEERIRKEQEVKEREVVAVDVTMEEEEVPAEVQKDEVKEEEEAAEEVEEEVAVEEEEEVEKVEEELEEGEIREDKVEVTEEEEKKVEEEEEEVVVVDVTMEEEEVPAEVQKDDEEEEEEAAEEEEVEEEEAAEEEEVEEEEVPAEVQKDDEEEEEEVVVAVVEVEEEEEIEEFEKTPEDTPEDTPVEEPTVEEEVEIEAEEQAVEETIDDVEETEEAPEVEEKEEEEVPQQEEVEEVEVEADVVEVEDPVEEEKGEIIVEEKVQENEELVDTPDVKVDEKGEMDKGEFKIELVPISEPILEMKAVKSFLETQTDEDDTLDEEAELEIEEITSLELIS